MRLGGWAAAVLVSGAAVLSTGGCGASVGEDGPNTGVVAVVVPGGEDASTAMSDVPEAVRGALADLQVPGWTVEVATFDADTLDAQQLIDDDVVAVIGGFSDENIRRLAPKFADASILFVSPHNNDRVHTRGADPTTSVRPYATYYTTASDGTDPLALLAYYATRGLGLGSIAAVDAGGEGSEERLDFARYVRRNDADVPVSRRAGSNDGAAAIAQAAERGVDALFVSGDVQKAATVVGRAAAAGVDVPLLVSPGLAGRDFLANVDVDEAVSVRPATLEVDPTTSLPGMKEPGPYAALSYDAGTAVGIVLERCLPSASSAGDSRAGCAGEMREVAFDGATGEVAFNDLGERRGGAAEIIVAGDDGWQLPD